MNNVNNAPHAERRCRIMRKDYGTRYHQATKVILEIFAPWWITTPTTFCSVGFISEVMSLQSLSKTRFVKKSPNLGNPKTGAV